MGQNKLTTGQMSSLMETHAAHLGVRPFQKARPGDSQSPKQVRLVPAWGRGGPTTQVSFCF